MRRIFDFLVLSFIISLQICMGYYFTAATMLILYGTVYAIIIDGKGQGN